MEINSHLGGVRRKKTCCRSRVTHFQTGTPAPPEDQTDPTKPQRKPSIFSRSQNSRQDLREEAGMTHSRPQPSGLCPHHTGLCFTCWVQTTAHIDILETLPHDLGLCLNYQNSLTFLEEGIWQYLSKDFKMCIYSWTQQFLIRNLSWKKKKKKKHGLMQRFSYRDIQSVFVYNSKTRKQATSGIRGAE